MSATDLQAASVWRARIVVPDAALDALSREVYGANVSACAARWATVARALDTFLAAHGDRPVCIARAPGRIALRGMHVDTHGGWINLMAHQREIVVVAALAEDFRAHFVNADAAFAPVVLDTTAANACLQQYTEWSALAQAPEARALASATSGDWSRYLAGALLRAGYALPERRAVPLLAAVASDLPRGAALSSSAALCLALLQGCACFVPLPELPLVRVRMARDAEWFAGARTGFGDQLAIACSRAGQVLHLPVDPAQPQLDRARWIPMPEGAEWLVVDTHTRRNLSGPQRVAYASNRFAYTFAMQLLRRALVAQGWSDEQAARIQRLSDATPEALGGDAAALRCLRAIPEREHLDHLRALCGAEAVDSEYARYFAEVPAAEQPRSFQMRGPLLFGLAESARAHAFGDALAGGAFARMGALLSAGHDGDRISRHGEPWGYAVDDAALEALAAEGRELCLVPGSYRASTPALDAVVDAALAGGALGASLTGAGLAGAVIVLCTPDREEAVRCSVAALLASPDYAQVAGLSAPLDRAAADAAIVRNVAVAPAGRLIL